MASRQMPAFDRLLIKQFHDATGLAAAGEMVRTTAHAHSPLRRHWGLSRIEALYELAFLRAFLSWEDFLEATLYRCMCGYIPRAGAVSSLGPVSLKAKPYPSRAEAERAMLKMVRQKHIAWYKPTSVLDRCQEYIVNGHHEAAIASHQSRLEQFASIRHRIAHHHSHARAQFDAATMSLAGLTYRGSRPGKFLRSWDSASWPTRTWLQTVVVELGNLASQIV